MSRFVLRSIVRNQTPVQVSATESRPWAQIDDEEPADLPGTDPFERLATAVLSQSKLRRYKDNVRVFEIAVGGHRWRARWTKGSESKMVEALTESFRKAGLELDGEDIVCLCKDLW